MSAVGSKSPFLEDYEDMSMENLLRQLDHSELSDLVRALADKNNKKAKLTSLVLIHRRCFGKVLDAWRRAGELSYFVERLEKLEKIKATATHTPKDSRSARVKGRIPVVEIKSSRAKEPVHDVKPARTKKPSEPVLDKQRSTSSGRLGIAEPHLKPVARPDDKQPVKNSLSSSISPKRVAPKTFKSQKTLVKGNATDRSASASKRDLNSSGLLDKSARSDRSQSPALNIGTRLYLQAEELKLKKEKLRQAYEPDFSFTPTLNPKAAQKKLSATIVSQLKNLKSSASATVLEPSKPQVPEVGDKKPSVSRVPSEPSPPESRQPQVNPRHSDRHQQDETPRSPDEFGFEIDPDEDELEEAIATIKSSHRTTGGSSESYMAEEEKSVRSTISYQEEDVEQSIQHKLEMALLRQMQGGEDDMVIKKIKTTMGKYS